MTDNIPWNLYAEQYPVGRLGFAICPIGSGEYFTLFLVSEDGAISNDLPTDIMFGALLYSKDGVSIPLLTLVVPTVSNSELHMAIHLNEGGIEGAG
jgi:hypothetical protein